MKKVVVSFLVVTLATLLAVVPAQAAVLATISQPVNDNIFTEISGNWGQSFTATATGVITTIRIAPAGVFTSTLAVYAGDGHGGTLLHSQSVVYSDLGGAFQTITLTTPVPVTNGQIYTFSIACSNFAFYGSGTSLYVGGRLWHDNVPHDGWEQKFEVVIEDGRSDTAPDDRINWKHGDGYAVLYPRKDVQGKPVLQVYCIDAKGNGYLGDIITQSVFDKAPAKPAKNTLVGETSACHVPVKYYVLTTGEYQINIGANAEGKVDVIIFAGLPPANIYYYRLKW